MKLQDLRIGNYLTIDGVLVRVRSVYSFTNGSFKNNEGTVEAYRYDSIFEPKKISAGINRFEPILLTEDWLVKFGFKKEMDGSWVLNNLAIFLDKRFKENVFLMIIEGGVFGGELWNKLQNIKLKHVHQLQNLYFALTNQELTIKK
jgi:hypothetical protein